MNTYYFISNLPDCQCDEADFIRLFSQPRMQRYIYEASNEKGSSAYLLYMKNTKLSASCFEAIGYLEVALRNQINNALIKKFGFDWMKQTDQFDRYAQQCLSKARSVSDLTFGFWTSLFGRGDTRAYDQQIWTDAIWPSLQNCKRSERKAIHVKLNHIRELRNRIAHHEAILWGLRLPIEQKHLTISEVCEEIIYCASLIDDKLASLIQNTLSWLMGEE
jgi:hypothetical protein